MSLVTGRVVLPYGATRDTTPVCGHIRYVWVGGVQDKGTLVIVPGVAIARIIDGVVEPVHLSPGRWLPVLVVDGCRYDLPEIIVDGSESPAPMPDPVPAPVPVPPVPSPTPAPVDPKPEPAPVDPVPDPHPVPPTPEPVPSPGEPVNPVPVPEPPAPAEPTVEVVGDGEYSVTAANVAASEDGAYVVEFDGAHYAFTHTGDGVYEIETT